MKRIYTDENNEQVGVINQAPTTFVILSILKNPVYSPFVFLVVLFSFISCVSRFPLSSSSPTSAILPGVFAPVTAGCGRFYL